VARPALLKPVQYYKNVIRHFWVSVDTFDSHDSQWLKPLAYGTEKLKSLAYDLSQ